MKVYRDLENETVQKTEIFDAIDLPGSEKANKIYDILIKNETLGY